MSDIELAKMAYSREWRWFQGRTVKGAVPKKAGVDFTPPALDTLITSPKCPNGMYHLDKSDTLIAVKYCTSPPAELMPYLTFEGLRTRLRALPTAGDTDSKKAVKFTDYKLETAMIPQEPGPGKRRSQMIAPGINEPRQNVALVRLVWKKKGTEDQRVSELIELCGEGGIEMTINTE